MQATNALKDFGFYAKKIKSDTARGIMERCAENMRERLTPT